MRKLYIIRDNEEDGRLLDALMAAGASTDDSDLDNPVCPQCGNGTLLAYQEDGEFSVVTWHCLMDDEGAAAEAWFLVCNQVGCTYEEQVERVTDPMGAVVFDIALAEGIFDDEVCLTRSVPVYQMEVIRFLRGELYLGPNRKLQSFLADAEFQYNYMMQQTRKWIDRVPPGKRVRFEIEEEEYEGTFLTGTDDGFMVLVEPEGGLLTVRADQIYDYQPRRPEKDELPMPVQEVLKQLNREDIRNLTIDCSGFREMVVIRGFHLQLCHVDKYGQYHVRCWDRVAAEGLGLTQKAENYWEGVYRRSDVERRYDLRDVLKVRGHWVDVVGRSTNKKFTHVRTGDPQIAAALGLTHDTRWVLEDDEQERQPVTPPTWSGSIPAEDLEEQGQVRVYHWPLPELQLP